ncbi:MAG: protein phosphatase 2C domain-containing protein [Thermodesulfobacteriota bacterium]
MSDPGQGPARVSFRVPAAGLDVAGLSHVGLVRRRNEDRLLAQPLPDGALLAVADGMGGEQCGHLAAETAVAALASGGPEGAGEVWLLAGLDRAQSALRAMVQANPGMEGMGATLTAVLIRGREAVWAHVGDSRLHLARGGELHAVTRDHTFLRELVEEGEISAEAARIHPLRQLLDQCLGCPDIRPDSGVLRLLPGDMLVLTSDGLHGEVAEEAMRGLLRAGIPLEERLRDLLRAALDAGGRDNATVLAAVVD